MVVLETSDLGRRLSKPVGMPRPKRSVKESRDRFPGWLRLGNLYNKCPSPEHEAIFLTLFHTGCRVSEAIELRRDQVAYNESAVYVYAAPVLKHKKKANREIMIPYNPSNLLFPKFLEYLDRGLETEGGGHVKPTYLLPAYEKFTHGLVLDRHTTRSTVYVKLSQIDPDLYPHQLRGWCAGMLAEEHDLNAFDLMTWFNWKTADMASHYARTRERALEAKLGIAEAPKLRTKEETEV